MKNKKSLLDEEQNYSSLTWKSISLLKNFLTRFGDVKPRRFNGNSVKKQKKVRVALIRARELGLIPYSK